MSQLLSTTESLCPVCLAKVPAHRIAADGEIFLEKKCQIHGEFRTVIWRGASSFDAWQEYSEQAVAPGVTATGVDLGCPFDCGLCAAHEAQTCTVVMEVTHRCDLRCPVCFANSNGQARPDPDLETIRRMYEAVARYAGNCSVQLSGGEPTTRGDLGDIIALGKRIGFSHIQVNTNGLRISQDRAYLRSLAEAGLDLIYLQFDGVSDDVYRMLRGRNLLTEKLRAIQNCADERVGVLLVPTIVPRTNDHQLGEIVTTAARWVPIVKGVHFQPVSYFGRYPGVPRDEDRITLPEIIDRLVEQSQGALKHNNFLPRRSADSHCSFNSVIAVDREHRLRGWTNIGTQAPSRTHAWDEPPASKARAFVDGHWRYRNAPQGPPKCSCSGETTWLSQIELESFRTITVTGMAFQDAWNIDLERLRKCCVHVVTPDARLVPFCAHYLSSASGDRLYGSGC